MISTGMLSHGVLSTPEAASSGSSEWWAQSLVPGGSQVRGNQMTSGDAK